jgi:hypothetical protein
MVPPLAGHHQDTASHAVSIHDEKVAHGMLQRNHQNSTASRVIKANNRATLLNLAFSSIDASGASSAEWAVRRTREHRCHRHRRDDSIDAHGQRGLDGRHNAG